MNVTQKWAVSKEVDQEAAKLFIASFYSSLSSYAELAINGDKDVTFHGKLYSFNTVRLCMKSDI